MKRKRKKQLLVELGFTAKEIQVVEELAASDELNTTQLLRNALRLYELRHVGAIVCHSTSNPVGYPEFD